MKKTLKNVKISFNTEGGAKIAEHRVHANPPPKAHAQKPNGGGYA